MLRDGIITFAIMLLIARLCIGQTVLELYQVSEADSSTNEFHRQLAYATFLFEKEDYFRAISEFKRFNFTYKDDSLSCRLRFMIGVSYFNAKRYDEASAEFKRVAESCSDRRLKEAAVYKTGETFFRKKEYLTSAMEFGLIGKRFAKPVFGSESKLMEGWSYLRDRNWVKSKEVFQDLTQASGETRYENECTIILSHLSSYDRIPHRSPTLAATMSTIIPGSGQMYCSKFTDGLMALTINGVIGYIGYDSFKKKYYAGEIIALYFGLPFYFGNIYAARKAAHRYNERKQDSFARQVEHILESIRLGLSIRKDGHHIMLYLQ